MEKVSADTVTEMSAAAALSAGPDGPPPTAQQMIEQIRAALTLRVAALARSVQLPQETGQSKDGNGQTAFDISHERAVKDLKQFESIVADVPQGFRLMPVLYSKIDHKQNDLVHEEYGRYVHPAFLRYLAEHHADELSALGICQQGIDQMKQGLNPAAPSGNLYDVNIDHIIERAGGGSLSMQKEVDPLMPPGSKPTFLINHFSNFVLLPKQVHELKNALNGLQKAGNTPPDQSKWVLMLVPEAGPGHSGYVAQPLAQGSLRLSGRLRAWQIAASASEQASNILETRSKNPVPTEKPGALLEPLLDDLAKKLTTAFNEAASIEQETKFFLQFYHGKKFNTLRQQVANLPPDQAVQLRKTLQSIDDGVRGHFNQRADKEKMRAPAPVLIEPQHQSHKHQRQHQYKPQYQPSRSYQPKWHGKHRHHWR